MTFLDTTQFECRNRECLQKSSSPGEDLPLPPPPPLNTTVSSTSSGSDGPATSLDDEDDSTLDVSPNEDYVESRV